MVERFYPEMCLGVNTQWAYLQGTKTLARPLLRNGCEFTWDVGLSVLALSAALFGLVVGIKGFSQAG